MVMIAYITEVVKPDTWPYLGMVSEHPATFYEPHNGHWRVLITLPDPGAGIPRVKDIVITVQVAVEES